MTQTAQTQTAQTSKKDNPDIWLSISAGAWQAGFIRWFTIITACHGGYLGFQALAKPAFYTPSQGQCPNKTWQYPHQWANLVWWRKKINIPIQRRVGLVFQDAQISPHKSVMNNLLFGYHNIDDDQRRFHPDEIIELLNWGIWPSVCPPNYQAVKNSEWHLGGRCFIHQICYFRWTIIRPRQHSQTRDFAIFEQIIHTTHILMLYVSHDKSEIQHPPMRFIAYKIKWSVQLLHPIK